MLIHPELRLFFQCRFKACQIALEQNRSGDAINHTLPLFPADIGRDQEVFCRLRRQPFVPQNNWDRHSLFQANLKFTHRLDCRTFTAIQLNGKAQQNLPNLMRPNERRDMGDVPVQRAPIEGFERLGGPAQFIAQGHPNPLGPIVECENSFTLH